MFSRIPTQLSMWGNNQYGDCVSAEEAFAKACNDPEIFIDDATVIHWARRNGFLNGADLSEVMDAMGSNGFIVGSQAYNDGQKQGVDYTNDTILQAALIQGPVKISIDSAALPSGAGNQQGWHAIGGGRSRNQDHCVGLSGYGPADMLYKFLGQPMPGGVSFPPICYLLFTWSTIGVVDPVWIKNTLGEAWVRNPTTVGVPPLPLPPAPPLIDWGP